VEAGSSLFPAHAVAAGSTIYRVSVANNHLALDVTAFTLPTWVSESSAGVVFFVGNTEK
jgi:hypothetical protein